MDAASVTYMALKASMRGNTGTPFVLKSFTHKTISFSISLEKTVAIPNALTFLCEPFYYLAAS